MKQQPQLLTTKAWRRRRNWRKQSLYFWVLWRMTQFEPLLYALQETTQCWLVRLNDISLRLCWLVRLNDISLLLTLLCGFAREKLGHGTTVQNMSVEENRLITHCEIVIMCDCGVRDGEAALVWAGRIHPCLLCAWRSSRHVGLIVFEINFDCIPTSVVYTALVVNPKNTVEILFGTISFQW